MPEWVVFVALNTGWVVMACGGILIAAVIFWFAVERLAEIRVGLVNLGHMEEAIDEWRQNHPEKYKAWRKANDLDCRGK